MQFSSQIGAAGPVPYWLMILRAFDLAHEQFLFNVLLDSTATVIQTQHRCASHRW